MDAHNPGRAMPSGVMLRLQGRHGLICVTPKSLRVVSTEREGEEAERTLGEKT